MLKKAIIGIVIFAGGCITGYFACDMIKKEKYKEEASKLARIEINEVKEIYKEKLDEFQKEHTRRLDEFESEQLEKIDAIKEKAENHISALSQQNDKKNVIEYNKLASQYKSTKYPTQKKEESVLEQLAENISEAGAEAHEIISRASSDEISILNTLTYEKTIYNRPEIIDPDEYGENEDYDTLQLTYFMGDKKLVDEDADDVIDEVDLHIGEENLKIFDEFPEATSLYIRNDELKMDFEILKDDFCYEEIKPVEEIQRKPHQVD